MQTQTAARRVLEAVTPDLRVLGERPLFPMAVYLCIGIALCTILPVSPLAGLLAVTALSALVLVLHFKRRSKILATLLLCVAAGYALACAALPAWAGDPWAPPEPVGLKGRVEETWSTKNGYTGYLLSGVTLDGKPVAGKVSLIVKPGQPVGKAGDSLDAVAELKRPQPSLYFGGFNVRGWYMRDGVRFTGFAEGVNISASLHADTVWNLPERARLYADGVLYQYLSPDSAALVSALLSGDTSGIGQETKQDFVDLGVAHLLAVSGLNISLTAGAAWLLCRKLKLPMPVSLALSFLVMAAYVLFAGLTASVMRAAAMWLVAMGALVFARRYEPMSSLAAAAMLILFINPLDLFDAGFQLSFAATGAMFLWVGPMVRHLPDKKWMKSFAGAVGVTVCVTVLALPIILNYFNNISLISPLANLVLVPASFVMQLAGTALLFVGFLPDAASLLGGMLDGYTAFYLNNVKLLSHSAATLPAPTPPLWLAAVFAALVLLASPSVARYKPGGRVAVFAAVVVVAALMLTPLSAALTWRSDAAIVSEGSSSLSVTWSVNGRQYAACAGDWQELRGYLTARGIAQLDGLYFLGAKPPETGAALVSGRLRVKRLYVPEEWLADPDAQAFLGKGASLGMEVQGAEEGPVEYRNGDGKAGVLILPAAGGRLAFVPGSSEEGITQAVEALRGGGVLALGKRPGKAERVLDGVAGISLVLPGSVAPQGFPQYNIVDAGSVEVENRGGEQALVPWIGGWADGIQGNFR